MKLITGSSVLYLRSLYYRSVRSYNVRHTESAESGGVSPRMVKTFAIRHTSELHARLPPGYHPRSCMFR